MARRRDSSPPTDSALPVGSRYAVGDRSVTFAMPLPRTGEVVSYTATSTPAVTGWYAVLRFALDSADLIGARIEWFAPSVPFEDLSDEQREAIPGPPEIPPPDRYAMLFVESEFQPWLERMADESSLSRGPIEGLTIRQVRNLRLGDMQTTARAFMAARAGRGDWPFDGMATDRERRSRPEQHYALLADTYLRLLATYGHAGGDLHANLGKAFNIAAKTAANQLTKARDMGLLTPAGQGRAGGALTPKAIAILREMELDQ